MLKVKNECKNIQQENSNTGRKCWKTMKKKIKNRMLNVEKECRKMVKKLDLNVECLMLNVEFWTNLTFDLKKKLIQGTYL